MIKYDLLFNDDFIPLGDVAEHLNMTRNEVLFMAKPYKIVHALLIDVESILVNEILEKSETKFNVRDIEIISGPETNEYCYYSLSDKDYLTFLNGESVLGTSISEIIQYTKDVSGRYVREVVTHSPSNNISKLNITLDTLYLKKVDVDRLEQDIKLISEDEKPIKPLSVKRENTLLKVIGALLVTNYTAPKYRNGQKWIITELALEFSNSLEDAGYTCEGLKDRSLRQIISDSIEQIGENKKM